MSRPDERERSPAFTGGSLRTALFVTEDWYVASHRLPILREAARRGHRATVITNVVAHRVTLEATGATVEALPLVRRSANPARELLVMLRLVRLLRRLRPDVLHTVALKPVVYGALAARFAGVPRVVHAVAGFGALFMGGSRARRLLRRVLARALRSGRATVIVQNPEDEAVVIGLGVRPERVVLVAGSGVDLERFAQSEPSPEPPIRVLYVGRLLADKGLSELHDAAVRLRLLAPDVRIQVAGDRDPHNPACLPEETIKAWGEEGVLELLGRREDIPSLLRDAHLVTLPSYREGLPKALVEAAAVGRPIVATDVPGCREVVTDGVNGRLVPPRDAEALAAAIADLAADRELRQRMGEVSHTVAQQRFDDRAVARRIVDLYEQVCS